MIVRCQSSHAVTKQRIIDVCCACGGKTGHDVHIVDTVKFYEERHSFCSWTCLMLWVNRQDVAQPPSEAVAEGA